MAKLYAELMEISAEIDRVNYERARTMDPVKLQVLDYAEANLRKQYRELMGI